MFGKKDEKVWGQKLWEDRKYFNFSLFCLVESEKMERWKKLVCINLLIYPLLKNDTQLKQKSDK